MRPWWIDVREAFLADMLGWPLALLLAVTTALAAVALVVSVTVCLGGIVVAVT